MLFHICLYMHIGEPNSCHAHTCIYLRRNIHVIYLHLKGNSTSYIHLGKHFRATSNMCTFIKCLTTYSTCTRFIWRVFVSCYLFYIYMYMVNNIFTPSRRKGESSPTCSHFHALLDWSQKLRFLVLESHSGTYSSSYKLTEHSKQQPYMHKSNPQAKIRKPMRKCHWGISPSTWWAHV